MVKMSCEPNVDFKKNLCLVGDDCYRYADLELGSEALALKLSASRERVITRLCLYELEDGLPAKITVLSAQVVCSIHSPYVCIVMTVTRRPPWAPD